MNRLGVICVLAIAAAAAPAASAQSRRPPKGLQPPGHLVTERLSRMTPEERERTLSKLPPERRQAVEQRLEKYNSLPEPAKQRLREEYNVFQQLPPEKQDQMRALFKEFNGLAEQRRKSVRRELLRLRNMPPDRRMRRMGSEKFKAGYSDSERLLMGNLLTLLSRDSQPQTEH
jgi:hypothetical protein